MSEGRRRLAAIMFTDLVGFSALAQRDEAGALRLLEAHRALVRPLYDRFGGREVKTMGDGSLVEFGSALEATECAVEMQRLTFERGEAPGERPLRLRIGVHVGDVVHAGSDVYGDAVNIASRIEPLAEGGGVCVTGPVFEQVHNKLPHPLRALERVSLKNIAAPVSVYRLELPWNPRSPSEPAPFVDRDAELGRLLRARDRLKGGEGCAIALSGEAGVGKSRLAEEFVGRLEPDGFRVLRGRGASGEVAVPYGPWAEVVRDLARDAPGPLLYKVGDGCAPELVRLVPELADRLGGGPGAGSLPDPSERRLQEGLLRFLANLGREAPTVVVLDDLRRADTASIHLLDHVARHLSETRVMLLLAFRDDGGSAGAPAEAGIAALVRDRLVEVVAVPRFDLPTATELLRRIVGGPLAPSGEALAPLLYEKSGGSPMVLEALTRSLLAEGLLRWKDGGWAPTPGASIQLPPALRSTLRQRLDLLEGPTVEVLRQAAVLGPEFTFSALRRLANLPEEELLLRLEEGLRTRILEERSVGPGRSTFRFRDRGVREALYEEVSHVRRLRYHARAAAVLEALASEGASVPSAELAYHFLQANDQVKALQFTIRAGEEAGRLFAREEAVRQYAVALEILEANPDDRRRAEILFRSGEQLDLLGRHTEAHRAMREAAELYERLDLGTEAGEVYRTLARRITAHHEPVRAMEYLEKARALLEARPPGPELARLYDTMGTLLFQQVRMPEASATLRRAIEVATRVGVPRVEASSRMVLASIVPAEESGKVWELLDTALALARKADARPVIGNVLLLKGIALIQIRGDGRAALRTADDAIDYARRGNDILHEMVTKGGLVTYVQWRLGDLDQAEKAALEHRAFAAGDPHRENATAIIVQAEVARARGDRARGEKLLFDAERLLVEGGDWTEIVHAEIASARCAIDRGEPRAAEDRLAKAVSLCRKAGPPAMDAVFVLEALGLLTRIAARAGNAAAAARLLEELGREADQFAQPLGEAFRWRATGDLRRQEGDPKSAAEAYDRAVRLWESLGWQLERALTELDLAAVLASQGETDRARVLQERARELLSRVGSRDGDSAAVTSGSSPLDGTRPV